MTDEELKDLIRDAAHDTTEMSDLYYEVLPKISEEDIQRCNELLGAARVSVTWDGDKPVDRSLFEKVCEESERLRLQLMDPQKPVPQPVVQEMREETARLRAHRDHLIAQVKQLKEEATRPTWASVAPDQMQDGKRYRVIFEGTWDARYWAFAKEHGGWIEQSDLLTATSIEEIGDHNG